METDKDPGQHDVVVIGGGAAGRSAALVLGRARRSVVVVDAGQPSNHVATGIGGFLGHDQQPPGDFYAATRAELAKYPTVRWHEATVAALHPADHAAPALGGRAGENDDRDHGDAHLAHLVGAHTEHAEPAGHGPEDHARPGGLASAGGGRHDAPGRHHDQGTHDGSNGSGEAHAGHDDLADDRTAGEHEHGGQIGSDRRGAGGGPDGRGHGWLVELDDGTSLRARYVVLAMGMHYDLPALPDVGPRWGASVFHCPFCHGWEHRDEPLVVLAGGPEPAERALLLRNWSADVTVVAPPGTLPDADRGVLAAHEVPVVDGEIARLHGPGRDVTSVELADGTVVPAHGVLVAAPHRQRTSLAADLGVALDASGHVVVDAFGRTSVDGVRAVGDLTTPMALVVHAAATGALAAVGIVRDIVAGRLAIR